MRSLFPLLLALTLLVSAGSASALTFTLESGCSTCDGLTGSLEILDNGGTFSVTLSLNSSGYDPEDSPLAGLNQVGFGGIQGWTSVSLDSAPTTTTTAWSSPVEANTSSGGPSFCSTGTTSDKVCTHGFASFASGDEHVWKFTVVGGTLKTDEWHIGGQFANSAARSNGRIISEEGAPGAPIPEPSAALAFGLGALVVARTARRR